MTSTSRNCSLHDSNTRVRRCFAAAAAAAARNTSGPLDRARQALLAVDVARPEATRMCIGILCCAVGDRSLPLQSFGRLADEVRVLTQAIATVDGGRLVSAIDEAAALAVVTDRELDMIMTVLSATQVSGVTELARVCGLSVKALRACVRVATGRKIVWWRHLARVRRFVICLGSSLDSVSQCAYRAGYSNSQQASRDCSLLFALEPTQLRARATSGE
jgi:AraC-like DNA-binding protein